MNLNDHKDQMPLPMHDSTNPAGKPLDGKRLQETLQPQPDQTGAEFGGYGQADHAFGRDAGSSSEEGGQGGSGDAGAESVPKTRRGGSDGGNQTRHSSSNDNQAQSAGVKRQGSGTPDRNHQDQGGQGNP